MAKLHCICNMLWSCFMSSGPSCSMESFCTSSPSHRIFWLFGSYGTETTCAKSFVWPETLLDFCSVLRTYSMYGHCRKIAGYPLTVDLNGQSLLKLKAWHGIRTLNILLWSVHHIIFTVMSWFTFLMGKACKSSWKGEFLIMYLIKEPE